MNNKDYEVTSKSHEKWKVGELSWGKEALFGMRKKEPVFKKLKG